MPADKNRRVLVIDDNRSIHDDFRKILCPAATTAAALDVSEMAVFGDPAGAVQQTQFELDSAYQGQEGVLMVKKAIDAGRPYALAFVDVRMPPGWDGVETTRRIWELDPNLQIVLCTAYSDYSWGEMFEKLGHRDGLLILKKPFDAVEAFQLAHALTEKWWLHRQSQRKMEELESRVAERTRELQRSNQALQTEVVEHQCAEEELRWKTAFLEAQVNSSIDGILVVDQQGRKALQNQRFIDLFKIPPRVAAEEADDNRLRWVADLAKDPEQFIERAAYLYAHPSEIGRDEIELKDGTVLDRYSSPVLGQDGKCYGRIWTFRDLTERKSAEEAIRESEERFSGAFEHAPIGLALVSPEGRWLKVNRALCDLVGYSDADLLTRTFQDITHPDDLAGDLENVRRLIAGEIISYQMEKRYIHACGRLVTVLLNVSLVRDGQGQPRYFISHIQDITERKRAENALRESNEKFHQLADNITDAFWVRSPDMREVHYISPAFALIWGRSAESLNANPQQWSDFVFPEDRERVRSGFAALTKDAPSLDLEYRIVRPDGEIRWVRARGFQIRDAAGNLVRLTGIVTDTTERKIAADELRESERRFSDMLRNLELVSMMLDREARITYCNDYLLRLTGWRREELIGRDWFEVFMAPALVDEGRAMRSARLAEQPGAWHHENEILTRSGAPRLIRWSNSVLRSASGDVTGTASIGEDITERKRLEAQILQSQKMETVGRLAGGVAHEFNSIMTAIIGQSELLLSDLSQTNPLYKSATEIRKAADRAATLTRQLLAYGRKQILRPEILDLNSVLLGMESTLRHLMGQETDVRIVPTPGLGAVKADLGQIEQVIMNMAMNAADAMPHGGKLTLETANVTLDQEYVSPFPDLKAGEYVMLAITDTGVGMSEAVKARVFEPFFSTKGVGQGTGLGLSTCFGIVKQSGGHLSVYSELARGAIFKIYLPQVELRTRDPVRRLEAPDLPRGTESILLVEDDPALREMAATLLRRLGYTVYAAANGIEALNLKLRRDTGHIDLLFTDVVMPHMSGRELADRVRALYPHTKILFTSAYTENAIVHQGVLNEGVTLLQKPFTPSALAHKLREMLDHQPGAP